MRSVLCGIVAMAAGTSCLGAVVSVTGAGQIVAPPPSLVSGAFTSSTQVFAINEKTNVLFNGWVDRYLPPVGVPMVLSSAMPFNPGPIRVNSHILHFDNRFRPQAGPVTGTVTFDKAIVGVIFTAARLNASDAALGNPGTVYPFGWANRGFSSVIDTFTLLNPFTIRFTFANSHEMDQLRVLTVPAPGVAACGAGLIAFCGRRRR